jgi:GNAT superfamily N-acetyltransferase
VVTFQQEKWADCVDEMRPIWPEHYEALSLDRDRIAMSMDEPKYANGDLAGVLHLMTARADGVLVGYYYGMLMNHLHYKDAGLMCYTDVYYLKPAYRRGGAGAQFMAAVMESLKRIGAVKLYISTKVHQDNGALFERLGMKCSDRIFTKMLGD